MNKKLIDKIVYAKSVSFQTIIEDGIQMAADCGADSFEYIVGRVGDYEVKVVMEKDQSVSEVACIDCDVHLAYTALEGKA